MVFLIHGLNIWNLQRIILYKVIVKPSRGSLKTYQESLPILTQEDLQILSRKIYVTYQGRFVELTREDLNSLLSKICKPAI